MNLDVYLDGIVTKTEKAQFCISRKEHKGKDCIILQVLRDVDERDTPEELEAIRNSKNTSQVLSDDGKQIMTQVRFSEEGFEQLADSIYCFIKQQIEIQKNPPTEEPPAAPDNQVN